MSISLQKILLVLAGVLMIGASYVLWSPGTFGLCGGEVRLANNPVFGSVQFCTLFRVDDFSQVQLLVRPLLFLGVAIVIAGAVSFFVREKMWGLYRKWFLISLGIALAFIYLVPEPPTGDLVGFTIGVRTMVAAAFLALSSIVGLGVAYWRGSRGRNAPHTIQ